MQTFYWKQETVEKNVSSAYTEIKEMLPRDRLNAVNEEIHLFSMQHALLIRALLHFHFRSS